MQSADQQTPLAHLKEIVRAFVAERDWRKFHSPKNITMALAVEAAELMEHFQWLTIEESRTIAADAKNLQAVREEMADVLCYLLALANELNVDLTSAVEQKMIKNRLKYPAPDPPASDV